MNLKDQVLSIEQVQELQELGFDVKKYARVVLINENVYIRDDIKCLTEQFTYSLTIGDIIKILPKMIGVYSIEFDFIGNQVYVDYIYRRESLLQLDHMYYMDNKECVMSNLINALFETLKWCIKEKHI